jgi:DNA-binding GntR family transcriptional regulator
MTFEEDVGRDKLPAYLSHGDLPPQLDRSLLKDRIGELLREYIISGRVPAGAKLVEREIAESFGVSRMPVRDALMQLETEGLVVSRPDARYVVELTEQDIRELYEVRIVLERLAAQNAARRTTTQKQAALSAKLAEMKDALERQDGATFAKTDVEIHRLIWAQAGNHKLMRTLESLVGPIFMWITLNHYPAGFAFGFHEEIVAAIGSGDQEAAAQSVERHMREALDTSLRIFVRDADKLEGVSEESAGVQAELFR